MGKQTKLLILILVMALALCLFSACNNTEENTEEKGGPYVISVENGCINGDKGLNKAEVEKGVDVEISAIIPEGKKFVKWVVTGTETVFSEENPYSFKALSDRSVTAIFEEADPIKFYTIEMQNGYLNDNPSMVSSTFAENTKISLYANVPIGKVFNGFYSNNALISKIEPYENYLVKGDATIVATFRDRSEKPEEQEQCELKIVGGTLDDSLETEKIYPKNTPIAVKATVLDTQLFDGWYENDVKVSSDQRYAFTIKYSRKLVAKCVDKPSYNVNVIDGTMDDADGKVMQGKNVKLTAYAETDSAIFDRWEVIINDVKSIYYTKEITLTVTTDINAIAYYNDKFKVSAYQKGEILPFHESFIQAGQGSVSIAAPKEDGYSFSSWVDSEGNIVSRYSTIVVQGIVWNTDIYAVYKEIGSNKTNILVHNGVAYEDAAYTKLIGDDISVSKGTIVYIKPNVSDGEVKYNSSSGSGSLFSGNNYKLTTGASYYDIDCTKSISIRMFNCKSTLGITNNVQVGQTYTFVQDIDILKNMFSDWSINDRPNLGTSIEVNDKHYLTLSITDDVLNGNSNLDINMLCAAILKVDVVNGTIDNKTSANVPANSEITIVADEKENKLFKEWRCNGQVVSTDEVYTFTIHNSGKYEAIYYDISTISYSDNIIICAENDSNLLINDVENKVLTFVKGSKIYIKSSSTNFPGWTLLTNTTKSNIVVTDATLEDEYYVYSLFATDQYAIRFTSTNKYYVKIYNVNNKGNDKVNTIGSTYSVLDSVTISTDYELDDAMFVYWQIGESQIEESTYTFLIDNSNIDAYAVYKKTYTVTILNSDANDSEITIKTTEGSTITLEDENEDPHHLFLYWQDLNDLNNKVYESSYEFELTKNISYKAVYQERVKITLINGVLSDGTYKDLTEGYYEKGVSIKAKGIVPEHADSAGWYIGELLETMSIEAVLSGQQEDTTFTFNYIKHAKATVKIFLDEVDSNNNQITYYSNFVNQKVSVDDIDGYRFDYIEDHLGNKISLKTYQIAQLEHGEEIVVKAYFIKVHKVTIINSDGYGNAASNREEIVDTGTEYIVSMTNTADYRSDAFIGWYIDGKQVTKEKTYKTAPIASDITIEAKFGMMYSQYELEGVGFSQSITNVIADSDSSLSSSISGLYVLPGLLDNISITGTAIDVTNGLAYVVGNVIKTNTFGVNNSVIFVLDMNATVTSMDTVTTYQGKLIKEILLREKGSTNAFTTKCNGVAITSKYLWIASNDSINGCGYLNGISLSSIASAKESTFMSFEEKICVPVNASFVSFVPESYTLNTPNNKKGMLFVGEYEDSTSSLTHANHHLDTDNSLVAWTVAYAIDETENSAYLNNGFKASAINTQSEESYIAATPDYVFYTRNHIAGMTKVGNKIVLIETDLLGDSYIHIYSNPFEYPTVGNTEVNGTGKLTSPYYKLDTSNVGVACAQNIKSITPYKESGNYYILVATDSGTNCEVDTAFKVKIQQ